MKYSAVTPLLFVSTKFKSNDYIFIHLRTEGPLSVISGVNVDAFRSTDKLKSYSIKKTESKVSSPKKFSRRKRRRHLNYASGYTMKFGAWNDKATILAFSRELKELINQGAVHSAERELFNVLDMHEQKLCELKPDLMHFGIVINGWCRSSKKNGLLCLKRAKNLLSKMYELNDLGYVWLQPNVVIYNNLIMAYAQKGEIDEAVQLLNEMESQFHNGNNDVKPNVLTLNFMIDAMTKGYEQGNRTYCPDDVEILMRRMMDEFEVFPDLITYNLCINAWAKSSYAQSARRTELILKTMIDRVEKGDESVKPDIFTYNGVLNAWSRSKETGAAQRAQDLLDAMEEMYRLGNDNLKPTLCSYSTVINAWSKSRDPIAGSAASKLLQRMTRLYNEGHIDLKPDIVTYTGVVQAMINKDGAPDIGVARKATQMLRYLESLYDETGDVRIRPDRSIYNVVIQVWKQYPGKESIACTKAIKQQMRRRDISTYRNPVRKPRRELNT